MTTGAAFSVPFAALLAAPTLCFVSIGGAAGLFAAGSIALSGPDKGW